MKSTALYNNRLERTRHKRSSLVSCVGEPLKRSVSWLPVAEMKAFFLLFLCTLWSPAVGSAQDRSNEKIQVIGPGQCQDYGPVLDYVSQNAAVDQPIIVIARRGKGDIRTDINRRRLHNVRTYWTRFSPDKRAVESVILAEGERVKDHGHLEIYVGGKLIAVLKLKTNWDLIVGNCYPEPLGAPFCKVKENRDFYPCLDRNRGRKEPR